MFNNNKETNPKKKKDFADDNGRQFVIMQVVKDSINPVFDETFEYTVAPVDLSSRELEVNIINRKGLFARSPMLGHCQIALGQYDLSVALTQWFDLQIPE